MARAFHYHYIQHDDRGFFRIWKSSNPGDQFDVVQTNPVWLKWMRGDPDWIAGFPESDDGTLICNKCIAERNARRRGAD